MSLVQSTLGSKINHSKTLHNIIRQTDSQTYIGQTDRQRDRQIERQIDKQTGVYLSVLNLMMLFTFSFCLKMTAAAARVAWPQSTTYKKKHLEIRNRNLVSVPAKKGYNYINFSTPSTETNSLQYRFNNSLKIKHILIRKNSTQKTYSFSRQILATNLLKVTGYQEINFSVG